MENQYPSFREYSELMFRVGIAILGIVLAGVCLAKLIERFAN